MTADGTDVTVVVVTYEAPEWTERCLKHLLHAARVSPLEVEVVVVDNDSGPATREVVANTAARTVQLDHNVGFGAACNIGVASSAGRLVMLLNPDTEITPGVVEALAAFHDADPRRGIVGGRTVSPDGATDPRSCWGAMTLWSLFCYATGLSTAFRGNAVLDPESMGSWQRDSVREVDVVTGCLLLTSRELWDRLEGFDEAFFMYGEDADLCMRARRAGYRPAITPEAEIVHAVGASSSSPVAKQRLLMRGRAHLAAKRWSGSRRMAARTLLLAGAGLRALAGRPGSAARVLWRERETWIDGWPERSIVSGR